MGSTFHFFLRYYILFQSAILILAQNLSTTASVPPLQWINLTNLLQGNTRPPPLKDAAIGYDETSRSLIIFGGISESGIAQSQTYLLNLQTLSWSIPSPPANLQRTPPARSAVVSGTDFAASNRHGFLVIGGKGADGKALSDIWEYDFTNQFWSQVGLSPGGPAARWGAAGGIDIRTQPISDPIIPGPNNTFYLAGGFDGKTPSSLSDVWQLSISGTLSSNLPDAVNGSWEHVTIGNLPGRIDQAGAVIAQQIIAAGGCDSTSAPTALNSTCAKQDSFIIDVERETTVSPGFCPAPRAGPVLVSNLNAFSTAFGSQVFLLLGTLNSTLWQDSNGINRGEVAILDINTGTWTRIIPSGDVDSSGSQQFPSPREGATAISFSQSLVGNSRSTSADTIVFGGQNNNGEFLSDLWLLRAYSGVITPSSPTWAGFGDGKLKSGVNADGSGVVVQYLTDCATIIPTIPNSPGTSQTSTSSTAPSKTATPTSSSPVALIRPHLFDTALVHKLLLPLSLVLLLPIFLFFRWTTRTGPDSHSSWTVHDRPTLSVSAATVVGLAAYGLGVAGFILSFTTIYFSSTLNSPTHRKLHLRTAHGVAGLGFFLCLYALVPLLCLANFTCAGCSAHSYAADMRSHPSESAFSPSLEMNEKLESKVEPKPEPVVPARPKSMNASLLDSSASPPGSPPPRQRSMSWDASTALRPSNDESGLSGDSTTTAPMPHKTFEVLNRPGRARKLSEPWPTTSGSSGHTHNLPRSPQNANHPQRVPSTRRLGEIDWLLRRRSLNTVGDLDYAITQAHNAQYYADVNAGDRILDHGPAVRFPSHPAVILRHILLQTSILGLCALTLSALWLRAQRYLFALFLVWVIAYYAGMLLLAYHSRPMSSSLLTATVWRLRGKPAVPTAETSSVPTPSNSRGQGPYRHHQPPVNRASTLLDEQSYLHSPLSVCSDENKEDDMDEDTRQRVIEEEMERRDVSIVTVPRRKLYLANPS